MDSRPSPLSKKRTPFSSVVCDFSWVPFPISPRSTDSLGVRFPFPAAAWAPLVSAIFFLLLAGSVVLRIKKSFPQPFHQHNLLLLSNLSLPIVRLGSCVKRSNCALQDSSLSESWFHRIPPRPVVSQSCALLFLGGLVPTVPNKLVPKQSGIGKFHLHKTTTTSSPPTFFLLPLLRPHTKSIDLCQILSQWLRPLLPPGRALLSDAPPPLPRLPTTPRPLLLSVLRILLDLPPRLPLSPRSLR